MEMAMEMALEMQVGITLPDIDRNDSPSASGSDRFQGATPGRSVFNF